VLDDGETGGFPVVFSKQFNPSDFYTTNVQQWTEEAQIQGKARDGKLQYTVGGYADKYWPGGPMGNVSVNNLSLVSADLSFGATRRSVAGYFQAVYDLGDLTPVLNGLNLTGGYRYSWDTSSGFASGLLDIPLLAALGVPEHSCLVGATLVYPNCGISAKQQSSAPNWLIGADYKFLPELLGYFHISEGYKAGGFQRLVRQSRGRDFRARIQQDIRTRREIGPAHCQHADSDQSCHVS